MPNPTRQNLFWVCLVALTLQSSNAFQPPALSPRQRLESPTRLSLSSNGGGFGKEEKKIAKKTSQLFTPPSMSSPAGDFAFQEMLVMLTAMQKEGATSRDMDPAKRNELEGYVRTVLANNRHKSLALKDIGRALVPKSEWKLMFSSTEAVLESLPNDATVFLSIRDEENLDYILKFSKKTMGLDALTAKCKYTFDAGTVQPGLLTFVYDKITTNILGLNNIGVGFFGMLKGRANYVESAYFDGTFWIEKGVSPTGNGDFVNIYMRYDDDLW